MLSFLKRRLKPVYSRLLDHLAQRIWERTGKLACNSRRRDAIYQIFGYLENAHSSTYGDYAEFGVAGGKTFSLVVQLFQERFPKMRFLGFDSFQGLPEQGLKDRIDGYHAFKEGDFKYSEKDFLKNVYKRAKPKDKRRIITIPGWFDSLDKKNDIVKSLSITNLSFVLIDCDLYESTVPCLDFISDLITDGSVVAFDDWRCFRNLPQYGEKRSAREWMEKTGINLHFLVNIGWNGCAFTVELPKR
ncbi:MAG: hypothetical protein KAV87_06585 [Desulfobacteraceae bacterium]|nr:hypothetical protein [Desulfobacteraceae bacterium]